MDKEQARMALLYKIKKDLLERYWFKQEETRQNELCKIAKRNQQLLRANAPTFMFEGKWYADFHPFKPDPRSMKKYNRILHADYYEPVYSLVHAEDFEDTEDRAQIANLVGNALNECRVSWDLNQLLPADLIGNYYMTTAESDLLTPVYKPSLTEEEIQAFKEKNKAGYQCLSRMKLIKLLLPNF